MKNSKVAAFQPSAEWRDGYVAGLTRASVALEDFRTGDGPSTARLPWRDYVLIGLARRIVGQLLDRVDELGCVDCGQRPAPKAATRRFELIERATLKGVRMLQNLEFRRRKEEQAAAEALMNEFCGATRAQAPVGPMESSRARARA